MAKISGLISRKDTYYLRMRVPQDVKAEYKNGKKTEIVVSLKTKDYTKAKAHYFTVRQKLEDEFQKIRDQKEIQKNNPDMLSGYDDYQLTRIAQRWRSERNTELSDIPDYEDVDPDILIDIEAQLHTDVKDLEKEVAGKSKRPEHYGLTEAAAYLEKENITYKNKSKNLRKLGRLFSQMLVEEARQTYNEFKGKPYQPIDPIIMNAHIGLTAPINQPDQDKIRTLDELIDEYMNNPSVIRGANTRMNYVVVIRALNEFIGGKTYVHEISRDDCKNLRDKLMRLPANAKKHFPNASLNKAIILGAEKNLKIVSVNTVNSYLAKLNALLNYAVHEKYILGRNPAERLNIADHVAAEDRRDSFSIDELSKLFHAPLYVGCQDGWMGYNKPGNNKPRNARFWIPLIGLFTGAREEEICQLEPSDIICLNGIHCFRLSLLSDVQEKKLKTKSSKRVIPVHPELKKIGFLQYVEKMKTSKSEYLFPHPQNAGKYKGDSFGKWFANFLKKTKIKTDKNCFHSFRHTFRDALREAEIPEEPTKYMGGWAMSGVSSKYGTAYKKIPPKIAKNLNKYMCKIHYDGLDLSHLYVTAKDGHDKQENNSKDTTGDQQQKS